MRFLNQKTGLLKKRKYNSINSRKALQSIFDRERERALRKGSTFSLLIIGYSSNGSDHSTAELINTIKNRIRHIDDLGWYDDQHIGVILPETSYQGARNLGLDIQQRMENPVIFSIYTYPDKDDFPQKHTPPRESSTAPLREFFSLFGKPIPLWKRVLDLAGAIIIVLFLLPLFFLVAAYIKAVSPGPVFFRQGRLGYLRKPFVCWKFRTMNVNADLDKHRNHVADLIRNGKTLVKIDGDPDASIIPFGNVLRKLGIDELPQLYNVLRGEMSLIGPRPCLDYEAVEFLDWQNRRFDIHPGLTGLWQVSGKNRTTFEEMMRLDIRYGQKRSPLHDGVIFIRTLPAIIGQVTDKLTRNINLKKEHV